MGAERGIERNKECIKKRDMEETIGKVPQKDDRERDGARKKAGRIREREEEKENERGVYLQALNLLWPV